MRYLADTHAILWWLSGDRLLTPAARSVLADDRHDIFVSAATAWEITTKHRLGKLPDAASIARDVEGRLTREGFLTLAITMAHAEHSGRMEGTHRDPFDRMMIAQALMEDLVLISNEKAFDAFGVRRLW